MTITKFFWMLYGTFFIFLIALSLMSMLLNLNKNVSIGLLVFLSMTFVMVSLILMHRKITKPIRMLLDSTHRMVTDLAQFTKVATGMGSGDLSQTAQIQTQLLNLKTKDEMGNLARDFNQMIAQLKEAGGAYAKMGETVKSQIADVNMLVQAAVEGNLSARADATWEGCTDSIPARYTSATYAE